MNDLKYILVTGASGFIGGSVCKIIAQAGYPVIEVMRTLNCKVMHERSIKIVNDLVYDNISLDLLKKTRVIVHCAGRAHIREMNDSKSLKMHRIANVSATERLARHAANAGVSRFIFISSVGVNGCATKLDKKYLADDPPAPYDSYTLSKYEAEQSLYKIAADTGLEVVIIRPPLVYGKKAPGNFGRLVNAVINEMPLPLGAISNARSLVALDNLVDLIVTCLDHPKAANQVFLVSDGEDVSTPDLLRRIAQAMGRKPFLFPVPVFLLEWGATMLGKRDVAQRLCGSLQVDIDKTRRLLGWTPPLTLDQGLKKAVEGMKP